MIIIAEVLREEGDRPNTSDRLEKLNVNRIQSLIQLANLRNQTLDGA
jgi:hypothetical protein